MDQRCETCRQLLPTPLASSSDARPLVQSAIPNNGTKGEVLNVELLPVGFEAAAPDPAVPDESDHESDSQGTSGDNPRVRRLGWVALAALLVVAFIWVTGRDAETGPVAGSTGDDGSRNVVDEQESQGPDATLGPFDRTAPFAEPEVVDAQSAALAELIGSNRLAYLTSDGIVIVDLEAGIAPTAEFTPESFDPFGDLDELSSFELLSDGDNTYGISKGDSLTVHRFSNSGRLVPTIDDGLFSVTSDPAEEWERLFVATSAGFFMADLEVPVGSTYVNIDGLGTLVSPPSGGTFLAGISGYEPYSDHRVVAGTATHQVEIRCDQTLECHPHLINRETGDWEQVPDEFAGDTGIVSVSPDGRWILRTGSDDDVAFDADTGGFARLDGRPKGPVVWAPDASFAVWFDPLSNEPLLQVLYPERRSSETIDLSELGAADRAGSAVLVFS